MFNQDFYPTPDHVADQMGIDCFGKTVLEPSAGSGNLLDYMRNRGAKQLLACEKDSKLIKIAKSKADQFITDDFMAVVPEQVSHIDMIVMNPPFSRAASHLLHAWEIAPEGCEIISLCNHESIDRYPVGNYREVSKLIRDYGYRQNLGPVFSSAERTTSTDIELIKLYKPLVNDQSKFEGFYMDDQEDVGEYGLMTNNEIFRIVGWYKMAIQSVDAVFAAGEVLESYTKHFTTGKVGVNIHRQDGRESIVINKEQFAVALQKKAWKKIFDALNMNRFMTSQVMQDINKFCERQNNVPFTVRNVRKMFEILVGTQEQIFNRSLVEAIDRFTKYTHENRYGVPGWKTNEGHLLNKKFIVDSAVELSHYGSYRLGYHNAYERIEDLHKVLCRVTGTSFDTYPTLHTYFQRQGVDTREATKFKFNKEYKRGDMVLDYRNDVYVCIAESDIVQAQQDEPRRSAKWHRPAIERNTWYQWGFFEIKCFKKGTMHLRFLDEKVWEIVNRKYAAIKGQVLPEKI